MLGSTNDFRFLYPLIYPQASPIDSSRARALGLALLYFAEPYIGLIPLVIWAVAYPAFFIIKNRKGLRYSKKKLFNPDQVAKNFEKSFESTYGGKKDDDKQGS